MKITVYGPGCPRCRQTEEIVRSVASATDPSVVVEKVRDLKEMMRAGVLSTPAVAVDGTIVVAGRIPKESEVRGWIASGERKP